MSFDLGQMFQNYGLSSMLILGLGWYHRYLTNLPSYIELVRNDPRESSMKDTCT